MVKKTIVIDDELLHKLELTRIMKQYHSFSELVSNALQMLIKKEEGEEKKSLELQIKKASFNSRKDPIYKELDNLVNDGLKNV